MRKNRLLYGTLLLAALGSLSIVTLSPLVATTSLVLAATAIVLISSYDLELGFLRLVELVALIYTGIFWGAVVGTLLGITEVVGAGLTIPLFLSWVVMAALFNWIHNTFKRERFAREVAWSMVVEDKKEPLSPEGLKQLRKYARNIKTDIALV